ncbi:MAG: hypothetical protein K2H69_03635 [Alistipes sp.]|nr:hypothetical protein [Alistipes sp.]
MLDTFELSGQLVDLSVERVDLLLHDPLVGQQPGVVGLQAHVLVERLGVLLAQQVDGALQRDEKIVVPLAACNEPRYRRG